jgi:hypothetical protein
MIVIEIDEEDRVSHFEMLGLRPSDLQGLDENAQKQKVNNARRQIQITRQLDKKAKLGDKDAEAASQRINQAATVLKDPETRRKCIEELAQGKAGTLDVLRVEHTAPAFFWNRTVRFRVIEEGLREMGWSGDLAG